MQRGLEVVLVEPLPKLVLLVNLARATNELPWKHFPELDCKWLMERTPDIVVVDHAEDVLGDEVFQELFGGELELFEEPVIQEVLIYSMDVIPGIEELIAVKIGIDTSTVCR